MNEPDDHEANPLVESHNKIVVNRATAMTQQGVANDEQAKAVAGEAIRWARQWENHTSVTTAQKEEGLSAHERFTGKTGATKEFKEKAKKFLQEAWGFIRKKNREGKTGAKSFKAPWGGYDDQVIGGHRLIPFDED